MFATEGLRPDDVGSDAYTYFILQKKKHAPPDGTNAFRDEFSDQDKGMGGEGGDTQLM